MRPLYIGAFNNVAFWRPYSNVKTVAYRERLEAYRRKRVRWDIICDMRFRTQIYADMMRGET